jgi:hypothetical protein
LKDYKIDTYRQWFWILSEEIWDIKF